MYFKQQLCCPIPDTARPCRVGGVRVLLSRSAVGAAFNCDGSMVANGPQVRRGYRLGSLLVVLTRPPFGGARDVAGVLHLSSTHRLGNLANGGAQTAPGSAAAYSLTAQAAPALPLINPNRTHTDNGKHTNFSYAAIHPGYCALVLHAGLARHYGEPAALADGLLQAIYSAPSGGAQQCGNPEGYRRPRHMNARRLLLIPNCNMGDNAMRRTSWQNLATSEAAGLCPEIAARGRADGATRPRPVTRPADARPRVCKTLKAQDYAPLRRAALFHPATARGGALRQGGHTRQARQRAALEIANALARRAPDTGYFSMTATNGRTMEK